MTVSSRFRAQQRGAVVVQAAVRMWLARRRYRTLRESVVKVQALARGRSTRKRVQRLKVSLSAALGVVY